MGPMELYWKFVNNQISPEDGLAYSTVPYLVFGGLMALFGIVLIANKMFEHVGVVAMTLIGGGIAVVVLAFYTSAYVQGSSNQTDNGVGWLTAIMTAWAIVAGAMFIVARHTRKKILSDDDDPMRYASTVLDGAGAILAIYPIFVASLAADRQEYIENGFSYANMFPLWIVQVILATGGLKILAGTFLWLGLKDRLPIWVARR